MFSSKMTGIGIRPSLFLSVITRACGVLTWFVWPSSVDAFDRVIGTLHTLLRVFFSLLAVEKFGAELLQHLWHDDRVKWPRFYV